MTATNYIAFGRPSMGAGEIRAAAAVLRSGWLGMGPETERFEEELAEFLGAPHVVSVNSCTSALFLSLLVSGVEAGDEVICPSFTWCSTANAALYLGARPVFCDIDPDTFNVTPETVRARLTSRTRAVIVVHMGGLAVDVAGIRRVLPRNVRIIEDAAHALGASYANGRPVGSSGNLCCFSFYANKNLSTGEGGAIALGSARLAARLRSLRLHGLSADAWNRYVDPAARVAPAVRELGYKMNYTDLQASIGRVQLRRQAEFSRRRWRIAQTYVQGLRRKAPDVRVQAGILDDGHARHLFQVLLPSPIRWRRRDRVVAALRGEGVGVAVHYVPLHRMRPYRDLSGTPLPVTDDVGSRVLTLPIGPAIRTADARRVLDSLGRVAGSADAGERRRCE